MARVTISEQRRILNDPRDIADFLRPHGIEYERWNVDRRIDPNADAQAILAAYAPEINALKARGGYVTADVVDVTPDTPGLDVMLERFNKEHTHSEDEVRFIVQGRGIFHIHPDQGPVFAIELEAGDWINVPRGTRHWFDLCAERSIRAIRLFQDVAGWTPLYTHSGIDQQHEPICFGPTFIGRTS